MKKYLEGSLVEARTQGGDGLKSLLDASDYAAGRYAARAMVGIAHVARIDRADIDHVARVMIAQEMYHLASVASAIMARRGGTFDPAAFGQHAEAIAREFAPLFSEVQAEEDSKTATKN